MKKLFFSEFSLIFDSIFILKIYFFKEIFVVFLLAVFVRGLRRRVQFAPQHEYPRKGRQPTHRWNRDSNRKTTMVSNPHACAGIEEKWEV